MLKKINLLFILGLLIPAVIIFKALFLPGTAVWGDAPYFYSEFLGEFPLLPVSWTSWGNNFGGINQTLWLAPLMLIYKFLYLIFGFNNDVLIRTVFYFPAILLSIITPIIFARSLGLGKIVQFFASLFYVFNTYFLLLIDGGQVGVALAYGLFPLSLISTKNFLGQPSLDKLLLSLILLAILTSFDPRVGLIALTSVLVWMLAEALLVGNRNNIKNLKWLIPLVVATAAVNSYWIIPILKLREGFDISVSGLQLLSLLNGLFFFQPHWPANEFGKVSPPLFYFLGIPLLVFGSLFFGKSRVVLSLTVCVLVFAFLVKGSTAPLGEIYNWAVVNLPFGVGFRDSSKFFIPLFLFGGLLIGASVKYLHNKWRKFAWFTTGAVYCYLLFLIHPAFLGNLNGVLTQKALPSDFKVVHEKLAGNSEFFRTAWFPNTYPFAFHTEEKPAVDARSLISERPFAALSVGTDVFNFIHQNADFVDWFKLLGIKYLIFSGDARTSTLSQEEQTSWDSLLSKVATTSGVLKQDWRTSFPVYSVGEVKPHAFSLDKAFLVLGGDDIYQKIKDVNSQFSVGNQAFLFFEDGNFDPSQIDEIVPDSAVVIFNQKNETDLTMSYLQKTFVSVGESTSSQWAVRNSGEYLKWKYELLTRAVDTKEFDYGRGIAFSTQGGEKITFNLNVPEDGEYVFASRILENGGKFEWKVTSGLTLKKGQFVREFNNTKDIQVLNTVALIPKKDWDEAQSKAKNLIDKFKVYTLDGSGDTDELSLLSNMGHSSDLEYQMVSPVRYRIKHAPKNSWIIFSDSFDSRWIATSGNKNSYSLPVYSMINGFYITNWDNFDITFEGQKYVKLGEYISFISIIFLALIFLMNYAWKRRR